MTESAETKTAVEPDGDDVLVLPARSAWRSAPVDAIVLLMLLLGANWFFARTDPGWLRSNPTPWLLLPFFLGGRYGAAAGVAGAALATVAILGLQWTGENPNPIAFLKVRPYFFLGLLLAGAVGTVVYQLVAGPAVRLRRQAVDLADRNRRLSEDVALYRANEVRLVESLLLHGSESVSLTAELRRLFAGEHGRFEDGLISLLEREFGVISAAIYRDETGRHKELGRSGVTAVGESDFPSAVPSPAAPLAAAALDQGCIATWQSANDDPGAADSAAGHRHLAAIPWQCRTKTGPRALLLIGRMEFSRIDWETLDRIEAVFAWCLARVEPGALDRSGVENPAGGRILPPEIFQVRIAEARRLDDRLGLPSRLILFSADQNAPQTALADFVERLKKLATPLDAIGAVGDGVTAPYSIGMLTTSPSTTAAEKTARLLLSRIGDSARAVRVDILRPGDPAPSVSASPEKDPTVLRTAPVAHHV